MQNTVEAFEPDRHHRNVEPGGNHPHPRLERRDVEDAARGNTQLRDLFFFDMLERGIYLARRGMINLSLVHEKSHVDELLAAVEDFITIRQPLLSGKAAGLS